jgi:C-terminal processing protease CtpA/Prc
MAASAGETAGPSPTALVRAAVEALDLQFFEPLAVPALLQDAWEGAAAALTRAGVSPVPPAPAYPTEPLAAYSLHEETFPVLERLTADRLGTEALAVAALDELLARRRDGHTGLRPRRRTSSPGTPDPSSPAGWAVGTLGMILTDSPPLAVADVLPRGPAQRAGVRRGQAVVAINRQPAAHLRRARARALFDWREGAANALTVRAPGGTTAEVELRPERVPMPATELLPGPVGLLRMDGFAATDAEAAALRAALTAFEDAGARGWLIDLRWCGGGVSIRLSRLLVDRGRLFSRQRHNEAHLPDGRVLPVREDIDADGTALPFQRPLVVLIGPGSISGAESFAGPMRAHGRATLVGERTAGMCGVGPFRDLAPGWRINLATHETVFGPEEWRLNRIGVTPDVAVTPTPDDEAAGRDPQLETALDLLRRQAPPS